MRLHREIRNWVLYVTVSVLLLFLLQYVFLPSARAIVLKPAIVILIWFAFLIWFFRFPQRDFKKASGQVYAPADGKVVVIEKTRDEEYFNGERIQVSIFMSPFDPHVNYVPWEGRIAYLKYHPGKYLYANHPKSSELNEHSSIVISGKDDKEVLMKQIAGAFARRIVYYCEEGDIMKPGEEIGFIKFGSRIDLLLPLDADIQVKLGQPIRAGALLAKIA